MPTTSFIVPTRNSSRTLTACLESIRAQEVGEGHRVELVVVDNDSTDGTFDIAADLADVCFRQGPERTAQRNAGARRSTGDLLVFVDSDMVLERGVASAVRACLSEDQPAAAAIIPERSFGEGFWAGCRVLEKDLYVGDPAVEAARAFRREAFEEVGGYDETLTACEDWDLHDRIVGAGCGITRVAAQIWHDEGRVNPLAAFSKKRYYGRVARPYLRRAGKGSVPRWTRTSLLDVRSLLRSPLTALGLVALKAVDATGFAFGLVEDALRRRREEQPWPS